MNNAKSIDDPFDDVKYKKDLKKELKIRLPGYGEKRNRRTSIFLENTIYKNATAKCLMCSCTMNEAVNQLLYIWSKDIKDVSDINNNAKNNIIDVDISFYTNPIYGEKRKKRLNIMLEPTIFRKSTIKCDSGGYKLTDAINKILSIWSNDENDVDDIKEKTTG